METLSNQEPGPPPELLTSTQFFEIWGETSGLSFEQFDGLWQMAQMHYPDPIDYPYHNFNHAVETLVETMRLADWCEANGLTVNRRALIGAALFHDAYYDRDYLRRGYESSESYSADIYRHIAPAYGFDEQDIAVGVQAIECTRLGVKPNGLEDRILVRADIANIGGEQSGFLLKNRQFFNETKRRKEEKGQTITAMAFEASSIKVLCAYLCNDLSLGPFDVNANYAIFLAHARANLQLLAEGCGLQLGKSARSYLRSLRDRAINKFFALKKAS